jgi:hypothetical protein
MLAVWCLFAPVLAMFATGEHLFFGFTLLLLAVLVLTA